MFQITPIKRKDFSENEMESDKDTLSDSGEAKKLTASSKKKRYDQKALDKWFLEETNTHFFKISESGVRCNRYKKIHLR